MYCNGGRLKTKLLHNTKMYAVEFKYHSKFYIAIIL